MLVTTIKYSILLGLTVYINVGLSGCISSTATQNKSINIKEIVFFKPEADSVIQPWSFISETTNLNCSVTIKKNRFKQFHLNYGLLKANLLKAPDEQNSQNVRNLIIDLPYPDGSLQQFKITKLTILSAALTAKYPELNAYIGTHISRQTETVKCECTIVGFKATITTPKGIVLVNNCTKKDSLIYLTYYKNNLLSSKN